jgi:hypothetical protein
MQAIILQSDNRRAVIALRKYEDVVVDMIQSALNGDDMEDLLADQVAAFALALKLQLPHHTKIKAAVMADRSWRNQVPRVFHWKGLSNKFGEFDLAQRTITLDRSMLSNLVVEMHTEQQADAMIALLFVKGLHEIGHALTPYCLRVLKYLYPKVKIPRIHTPVKVGTIREGKKDKGDAGNSVEELLSNGMRFTYEWDDNCRLTINRLTLVNNKGTLGLYVPDGFIQDLLALPHQFYHVCTLHLSDHSRLQVIPKRSLTTRVVKNAHGRVAEKSQWPNIKN